MAYNYTPWWEKEKRDKREAKNNMGNQTESSFYTNKANNGTIRAGKPRYGTISEYDNAIKQKNSELDKLHHQQYQYMIYGRKNEMDVINGPINKAREDKQALENEMHQVMGLGKGGWLDKANEDKQTQQNKPVQGMSGNEALQKWVENERNWFREPQDTLQTLPKTEDGENRDYGDPDFVVKPEPRKITLSEESKTRINESIDDINEFYEDLASMSRGEFYEKYPYPSQIIDKLKKDLAEETNQKYADELISDRAWDYKNSIVENDMEKVAENEIAEGMGKTLEALEEQLGIAGSECNENLTNKLESQIKEITHIKWNNGKPEYNAYITNKIKETYPIKNFIKDVLNIGSYASIIGLPVAGEMLSTALNKNGEKVIFKEDSEVCEALKNDDHFLNEVMGNFDSKIGRWEDDTVSINFNGKNTDLHFGLGKVDIHMEEAKLVNGVWQVKVMVSDDYNFDKWEHMDEGIAFSIGGAKELASTELNNMGLAGQYYGIVKPYEYEAELTINIPAA